MLTDTLHAEPASSPAITRPSTKRRKVVYKPVESDSTSPTPPPAKKPKSKNKGEKEDTSVSLRRVLGLLKEDAMKLGKHHVKLGMKLMADSDDE